MKTIDRMPVDINNALNQREIKDKGNPERNREYNKTLEKVNNNSESETVDRVVEKVEPDKESLEKEEIEKIEKEREIQEARKRIENMPDKEQEDNNKQQTEAQEQYSGKELFEKAREEKGGVEEVMRLSIIGNVSEKISNTSQSQEARDKTAERKAPEVIKALEDIYGDLENIKENFGIIMDIGAGWGENLRDLAEKLEVKKAIGVDPNTIYSEKVNEKLGDKLAWVKRDAMEVMKLLKAGAVDMSTLFAFLQILDDEEKIKILEKIGEVTKEAIVIVDELKRDGFDGLKDLFTNKLYNAGMGKYKVLSEDGWKEIFKKAGLAVEVFNEFGNNDFVAILKKAEQADEVEQV